MLEHQWTLRRISPGLLRALVRNIASGADGVSWQNVWARAVGSMQSPKELSNARRWHYSSMMRCLGLAEVYHQRYRITELGRSFLECGDEGTDFSDRELAILRIAALNCGPVRSFLGFFAGKPEITDLGEFFAHGMQIYCQIGRWQGEIWNSFGVTHVLVGRTQVNQWEDGLIPLCKQLRLVDELHLPPGYVDNLPSNHVVFPIVHYGNTEWVEQALKDTVRALAKKTERILIPQLLYTMAIGYKVAVNALKAALISYIRATPSRIYLDRVSALSVKGYEDSFLEMDGVWRSSLTYE